MSTSHVLASITCTALPDKVSREIFVHVPQKDVPIIRVMRHRGQPGLKTKFYIAILTQKAFDILASKTMVLGANLKKPFRITPYAPPKHAYPASGYSKDLLIPHPRSELWQLAGKRVTHTLNVAAIEFQLRKKIQGLMELGIIPQSPFKVNTPFYFSGGRKTYKTESYLEFSDAVNIDTITRVKVILDGSFWTGTGTMLKARCDVICMWTLIPGNTPLRHRSGEKTDVSSLSDPLPSPPAGEEKKKKNTPTSPVGDLGPWGEVEEDGEGDGEGDDGDEEEGKKEEAPVAAPEPGQPRLPIPFTQVRCCPNCGAPQPLAGPPTGWYPLGVAPSTTLSSYPSPLGQYHPAYFHSGPVTMPFGTHFAKPPTVSSGTPKILSPDDTALPPTRESPPPPAVNDTLSPPTSMSSTSQAAPLPNPAAPIETVASEQT